MRAAIMARIATVQAVIRQGRTRAGARENVLDALRLMLAPEPGRAGAVPPDADFDSLKLTLSGSNAAISSGASEAASINKCEVWRVEGRAGWATA